MSTPAGWYDDGSGRQRWWDGSAWTEHLAPAVPQEAGPEPASSPQASPAQPYPVPAAPMQPQSFPGKGLGVASLVVSIVAGLFVAFFGGVVGAILGHVAMSQSKAVGVRNAPALAGVIVGWVLAGLGLLMIPVIAAIAIPVYLSAVQSSKDAPARSAVSDAATSLMAYAASDDEGLFPADADAAMAAGVSAPDGIEMNYLVTPDRTTACIEARTQGSTTWYFSELDPDGVSSPAKGRCQ